MDSFIRWVRTQLEPFAVPDDNVSASESDGSTADRRLLAAVLADLHLRTQGAAEIWTSRRVLFTQMVERWYKTLKQAHSWYQKVMERPDAYPVEAHVVLHYHTYFQHLGQTVLYYLQDHYNKKSYSYLRELASVVYDRMPYDWFDAEALTSGRMPLRYPERLAIDLPVRDLAAWLRQTLESGERSTGLEGASAKGEMIDEALFDMIRHYSAIRPLNRQESPYLYTLLVFPETYMELVSNLSRTLEEDPAGLHRVLEQEKRRGKTIARLRQLIEKTYHHDIEPISWFES